MNCPRMDDIFKQQAAVAFPMAFTQPCEAEPALSAGCVASSRSAATTRRAGKKVKVLEPHFGNKINIALS